MVKFLQKHKKKFIYSICGIGAFYTLFGFFGVPLLIEKAVPKILENEANFSVKSAKFNPFTYELNITAPSLSTFKPLFSAEKIDVKLKFGELFNKTIDIQTLRLQSPKISISRENNGSFNFESLYANSESEKSDENSSINVKLDNFKIENGGVFYEDLSLERPFKIELGSLNYEIAGLNLASNSIGNHDFNASSQTFDNIFHSGSISLNPLKIEGNLSVENLKINPFWLSFLDIKDLNLLGGKISANALYEVILDEEIALNLKKSKIALNDLALLASQNLIKSEQISLANIDFDAKFGRNLAATLGTGEITLKNNDFLSAENNASLGEFRAFDFGLKFGLEGENLGLNANLDKINLSECKFNDSLINLSANGGEISQISANFRGENNASKTEAKVAKIEILPLNLALAKFDKINLANLSANDFSFQMGEKGSNLALNSAKFGEFDLANKNEKFSGIKNLSVQKLSFALDKLALNIDKIGIDAPFFNSEISEEGAKSINDLSVISYAPSKAKNAKFRQNLLAQIHSLAPEGNFTQNSENNGSTRSISPAKNEPKFSFAIAQITLNGGHAKITESFVAPQMTHNLAKIDASVQNLSSNFSAPFSAKASVASDEIGANATSKITINPLNLEIDFDVAHPDLRKANPYLEQFLNAKIASGSANLKGNFKFSDKFALNAEISGKNLALNDAKGAKVFSINSAKVGALSLNESKIDIKNIAINAPYAKIHIAKNGEINLAKLAKTSPKSTSKPASKSPAPKAQTGGQKGAFGVNISNVSVQNGSFNFIDDTLFMPLNITVSKIKTTIDKISDKSQANLKFNGLVGKSGLGQIALKAYPFAPEQKSDISVVLKDVALSDITPYSAKFVGYEIKSGKSNLKLNYKINASKLNATNDINLDNLVLGEKVESKDALDLPLDLAISILKDSDGQINVSLPISGNLNDPKFSFGGVIVGAVTKLFSDIVLSPFRFLGKIAGIDTASLDGIDFEPASSEILISENEKIENLATIAKSKPEIKITLTPAYNEKLDTRAFKLVTLNENIDRVMLKENLSSDAAIASLRAKHRIKEGGEEGFEKLIQAQKFTTSRLENLAVARAKSVQSALANLGVSDSQIVIKKPANVSAKQDSFISVGLGVEK
ncbi:MULTISPECIES: DUF748 domain-containing protein [unclassified Campylobacter]|uniref:DUF748 domain-containing protein n=1 Tax=unclassified Campylobacter TaxID=2593542 RepID=UPI0022E9CB56|nr:MULTISPECIES: DUF748 domain-containing protein [unclassified Campylobacter]MDA3062525.1 DUF748 domain-containing protein [Campylobacter sp. JMF_14 EL1]MDA3073782.1 DUF748 domain-containing protein [Campylobacter sp. JMF_10 EL2]